MKKLVLLQLFFISSLTTWAQCVFDPTVVPGNLILCPAATDTLGTQSYDAYQWYENNIPISGATNQYYVVSSTDAGNYFSVSAMLNGCTEMSPQVLVDGWVFLLPFVIHSGDLGYFDSNLNATVLCIGDTLILSLGQPYTANIQWFSYGDSIIGANSADYYVTESGLYTVCGAPGICPDFIQCLGVDINVAVINPLPVISLVNDTLFCTGNNLISYQWYFNGNIIAGATNSYYVPSLSGDYEVVVEDISGCIASSEIYTYLNTGSSLLENNNIKVYPNPVFDFLYIETNKAAHLNIDLINLSGQVVNSEVIESPATMQISVSGFSKGVYFLRIKNEQEVTYTQLVKQ